MSVDLGVDRSLSLRCDGLGTKDAALLVGLKLGTQLGAQLGSQLGSSEVDRHEFSDATVEPDFQLFVLVLTNPR